MPNGEPRQLDVAAGLRAMPVTPALVAAAHATSDAVLVVGRSLTIAFANPAAERLVGRRAVDLLGRHPREALDPFLAVADATRLWEGIAAGHAQPRRLSATARGGANTLTVEVLPARDPSGDIATYALLVRDGAPASPMTSLMASAALLGDPGDGALWSLLGRVHPGASVEATSTALCESIAEIDGLDGVMILLLPPTGDIVHVTSIGPPIPGFDPGARIPIEQIQTLASVIAARPMCLDLAEQSSRDLVGAPIVDAMVGLGITAVAYSAILAEGTAAGVLAVASLAPDGARRLTDRLDFLARLGAAVGAVMGHQAVEFGLVEAIRQDVRDTIATAAFHPVFQPIVRLAGGAVESYEALTRFDSGARPDVVFADAHRAGLGVELEQACADRALRAAAVLPSSVPLSINLSPESIEAGAVEHLLAAADRRLIIEITEHAPIEAYEGVHRHVAGRPRVDVAVDDAGAGFASLRHILELQPAFVKLDIGLVRGVHADPARAGLVAGMRHFAQAIGARLVAEGVETAEEAAALSTLGVDLAQGYLFGRPGPLPHPVAGS